MDKVRSIGRRSFLARVAGGALMAGTALAFGATQGEARQRVSRRRMLVDADPRDPARPVPVSVTGHGRSQRPLPRPPSTDSDPADPVGNGRSGPVGRFVVCPGNARCPRRLP